MIENMTALQRLQQRAPYWGRRDYEMVARIIRKIARYQGEQHSGATENERVRLTVATLFADEFGRDNVQFDRSRFLKACNNGT